MDAPQQPPQPKPILDPKEQLNLRIRAAERAHDTITQFGQEANSAAIKSAEEAIKAVILINGGSCVAMLAFIGTLASKDVLSTEQLSRIMAPLFFFGSGVAAGVVAAAAAYFTNLMIAGSAFRQAQEYEVPFLRDTGSSKQHRRWGEVFRYIGVLTMIASITCFIVGLIKAETAFQGLSIPKAAILSH